MLKKAYGFISDYLCFGLASNVYKSVKNRCSDKNILILGNGPSLNKLSPELINQYDSVCVCNHFYNHEYSTKIDIDFYCVSDPRLFFPLDFGWLKGVKKTKPKYLVVPSKFFYIRFFYGGKILFYKYKGENKIWENNDVSFDLIDGVGSGDTVVSDISIPLAAYCEFKDIYFCGIDLSHGNKGVQHAYDESKVTSKRRSDKYLLEKWPSRTSASLSKQFDALKQKGIKFRVIEGSEFFRELVMAHQ